MIISNVAQVNRLIRDTTAVANAVVALQEALDRYDVEQSTNLVHDALTAPNAQFPNQFTLTPAQVEDARFALGSFRAIFNQQLAPFRGPLDTLRLQLGNLAGIG